MAGVKLVSLRILTVGRGTAARTTVDNGHMIDFVQSGCTADGFVSLASFDFVFQHLGTSNPEAKKAIERWIQEGRTNSIIGFSGGSLPEDFQALPIVQVDGLATRQDILDLKWAGVPSDFRDNANHLIALLRPAPAEFLAALAILCQGYLVAYAHERVERPRSALDATIGAALNDIGLDDSLLAFDKDSDRLEQISEPAWWRKVFSRAKSDTQQRVAREWGTDGIDSCPKALVAIVNAIYSNEPIDAKLASNAYLAVAKRLRSG